MQLERDRELLITGYTWTYVGEFCYFLCCLVSLHWIALYVLVLVDTYNKCEIGGIDNLCFFGNNVIFGTYKFNGKVRSSVLFSFSFSYVILLGVQLRLVLYQTHAFT